jgi:hypothetical protein
MQSGMVNASEECERVRVLWQGAVPLPFGAAVRRQLDGARGVLCVVARDAQLALAVQGGGGDAAAAVRLRREGGKYLVDDSDDAVSDRARDEIVSVRDSALRAGSSTDRAALLRSLCAAVVRGSRCDHLLASMFSSLSEAADADRAAVRQYCITVAKKVVALAHSRRCGCR